MASCAKVTIIVMNVILGCVLIALGSYCAYMDATDGFKDLLKVAISSFILALICILAILGAALENRPLLIVYIVLVSIGLVGHIAITALLILVVHVLGDIDNEIFLISIGVIEPKEIDGVKYEPKELPLKMYLSYLDKHLLNPRKELKFNEVTCCGCNIPTNEANGVSGPCPPEISSLISKEAKETECCREFHAGFVKVMYGVVGIIGVAVLIEIATIVFACIMCSSVGRRNMAPPPMMMYPHPN